MKYQPDPLDVPGRGVGYPIQVGFSSNFSECKKCGLPVYFTKNPETGKRFSLDPRHVVARKDAHPGTDGISREWIWCLEHRPFCGEF